MEEIPFFTPAEYKKAVARVRKKKTPDLDGIGPTIVKAMQRLT